MLNFREYINIDHSLSCSKSNFILVLESMSPSYYPFFLDPRNRLFPLGTKKYANQAIILKPAHLAWEQATLHKSFGREQKS